MAIGRPRLSATSVHSPVLPGSIAVVAALMIGVKIITEPRMFLNVSKLVGGPLAEGVPLVTCSRPFGEAGPDPSVSVSVRSHVAVS